MKLKLLCVFAFLSFNVFSQSPKLINYQGAARRTDGSAIGNRVLGVKFEIIEGAGTGTVVGSETQTVSTNILGLFSTQIGKSGLNFAAVNWQNTPHRLQISIDTTGGTSNFIGTFQNQISSTPFAFNADDVPSTYTNNVLTIGKSTYTIVSAVTPTINTLGAISSSNSGSSFTLNVPNPTLSLNGASLSISNGNTITLPSQTSQTIVPQGALSVTTGLNSFTLSAPAQVSQTITGSGMALIQNGVNTATVSVPNPTLSINANSLSINGGNTVVLPAQIAQTITAQGIASVTNGLNTATVLVANPVLSNTSNVLSISQGTAVSTVTLPAVSSASFLQSGVIGVSTLSANSYSLNVPAPVLTNTANVLSISQGTATSTVTIPITHTIIGAGLASVSPSSGTAFTVSVPSPSLSNIGGSISLSQGTVVSSVALPVQTNQTITGVGIVNAGSVSANSFTVSVPNPSLSSNANSITLTQGSVVSTATIPAQVSQTITVLGGIATVTNGVNSASINVPSASLSSSGNSLTLTNGTVVTTATVPTQVTQTISGAGIASVTSPASNSFVVTVNQPTFAYSQTNGSLTSGTSSANITPSLSLSGTTLTSGPASNSINFSALTPWAQSGGTVSLLTSSNIVSIGANTPSLSNTGLILGRNGAFDNRMVITGGDNSNTYGGMLTITENQNQTQGMTLKMDASANRFLITSDPTGTNYVMGIGGYSGINQGVSLGNGYALSNPPANGMIVQGNMGIGTPAPTATLHVAGTSRFVDGTEGAGKVLTSDASGNASWAAIPSNTYAYSQSTGSLTSGTSSVNITPSLSLSGYTISSGPASNSINLSAISPWSQTGGTVALNSPTSNVGIGVSNPTNKLAISSTTTTPNFAQYTTLNFNPSSNPGGAAGAGYFMNNFNGTGGTQLNTAVTGYISLAGGASSSSYNTGAWLHGISQAGNHNNIMGVLGSTEVYGATIGNVYGGYFTHMANTGTVTNGYGVYVGTVFGNNKWSLYASDASAPNYFAGMVGIGTTAPAYSIDVIGTGGPRARVYSQDGNYAGYISKNSTREFFAGVQGTYEAANGTNSGYHIYDNTAGARRMVIDYLGRMGINNSAPTATLDVLGTFKLADGTQGAGKVLTSDASGNATWSTSASSGWGLTGNAGTSTLTNFIGTTDNVPLVFKVFNTNAGTINNTLQNVFFGFQSGVSSTGGFNTAVGHRALFSNLGGTDNTAIGNNALQANTSGLQNSALGEFALRFNTTGSNNTASGYGALHSNTTGGGNSAYASYALYSNTTGSDNTAMGRLAMFSNTAGINNTAYGTTALYNNTGGSSNVASGFSSLYGNTTGNENTSTGFYTMYSNTIGSYNTSNGSQAMFANTSGQENVAMGRATLSQNTTGSYNTAIGNNALYSGSGGNYNTSIGFSSGYSSAGTSGNVFLGSYAGYYETTSNKLWISNSTTSTTPLIYGDFASGKVGINTSTGTANFQVNGTTRLVDGTQGAGKVLTSDASGNATWSTVATPSRVRSIVVEPGAMNITGAYAAAPATYSMVGGWQRPCVVFPDAATSQVQLHIAIPSDWNAASSFTVRILYGSPSTSGIFDMQTLTSNIGINVSAVTASSGGAFTLSQSSTVEGLSEFQYVMSVTSTSKVLQFTLRRNGSSGTDTSTDPMRLYGIAIDYRD